MFFRTVANILTGSLDRTMCVWKKPSTWTSVAALWLLFVVAAPFGTDHESLLFRLYYWLVMTVVTFFLGTFVGNMCYSQRRGQPRLTEILAASVATGFVVAHVVLALDSLLHSMSLTHATHSHEEGLIIILFCTVLSGGAFLFDAVIQAFDSRSAPRLLNRLPSEMHGELISISGDGRYVEVTTTRGCHRVLIRLCDAVSQAYPTEGVQIHRSHWIALDHLHEIEMAQGRYNVVLSDGRRLPVSPTGAAGLQAVGAHPHIA